MKRSEMIEAMIRGSREYNPTTTPSEHQMSAILDAMESAGMQPPCYTEIYEKGSPREYYYPHGFAVNKWEPGTSVFDRKPEMTAEELEAFVEKYLGSKKEILVLKSDVDQEGRDSLREFISRVRPFVTRKISHEQTEECPVWDSYNQIYCESDAEFRKRILGIAGGEATKSRS